MTNYNLKIPLDAIQIYNLSPLTALIYGEIYDICSKKNGVCYITTNTLKKRHHSSRSAIQRSISSLKKANLIKRIPSNKKEIRNLIILSSRNKREKYILIPDFIINDSRLFPREKIIYGYLASKRKKIEVANKRKYQQDTAPIIVLTKSQIASKLNTTPNTVRRGIKHLRKLDYIKYTSVNGRQLEIYPFTLNEICREIFHKWKSLKIELLSKWNKQTEIHHKWVASHIKLKPKILSKWITLQGRINPKWETNLHHKWVSTYIISGHRPTSQVGIDLHHKWHTNKERIKGKIEKKNFSNKSKVAQKNGNTSQEKFVIGQPLKEPIYYDSFPSEQDEPPIEHKTDPLHDITELNQLDHDSSQQVNATETENKPSRDASKEHHSNPKPQENKYEAYNGFNLEYQVNQLTSILNARTGKRYVINAYQKPLIEQRLDDKYSLNDFERAIDYLIQQKEAISVKDLATHLPNYLSKSNSS